MLLGYILLKRPLHECIAGFLKATVGYFILTVGSGGLVNNFRPILVGLKERFNLDAMVTDPYFGQNAVDAGLMETFGRTFGDVMILLLIAFVLNILLVRFQKYTKLRSVFKRKIDQSSKTKKLKISNYQDSCRFSMRIWLLLRYSCYFSLGSF